MFIAQKKRAENIAEYILYLWQLEDLLRALQFSPEAIWSQLVEKQGNLTPEQQQQVFMWYMELSSLLKEEVYRHLWKILNPLLYTITKKSEQIALLRLI